ncbi:altronate dehydratase small subunit [Cohaesibacter sp. ES.047]|uniref:UxaA family hydrolase n=1 Tax=Cohaesibacter sp. ES.047 TaxID=1798205 RepID=UPI000BB9A9B3|nr:UxaA family hydrolase [Cohaesibacter sp. ES.047]SNY90268.1 altronate dehydratase small subunit [Cohaesibacter sp. ES.047]
MSQGCFRIDKTDNVATLLSASLAQDITIHNADDLKAIRLLEAIETGHKVALSDIQQGEAVIKFGVPIGLASKPIKSGEWVHLHNCESQFDERSSSLDIHSGATTDTHYE